MHKNPRKIWPVVSTFGTYLHALSWWVDHHLKTDVNQPLPIWRIPTNFLKIWISLVHYHKMCNYLMLVLYPCLQTLAWPMHFKLSKTCWPNTNTNCLSTFQQLLSWMLCAFNGNQKMRLRPSISNILLGKIQKPQLPILFIQCSTMDYMKESNYSQNTDLSLDSSNHLLVLCLKCGLGKKRFEEFKKGISFDLLTWETSQLGTTVKFLYLKKYHWW